VEKLRNAGRGENDGSLIPMIRIRNILCHVDFFPASEAALSYADLLSILLQGMFRAITGKFSSVALVFGKSTAARKIALSICSNVHGGPMMKSDARLVVVFAG
jgi:hypothetical protein